MLLPQGNVSGIFAAPFASGTTQPFSGSVLFGPYYLSQHPQEDQDSKVVGSLGTIAGTIELTAEKATVGTNFKIWIRLAWEPVCKMTKLAGVFRSAGVGMLMLGTYLDFRAVMRSEISPAHAVINLGVGAGGMSYGWYSAVPATAYFAIDNFYPGGWEGALEEKRKIDERMLKIDPGWQHPQ